MAESKDILFNLKIEENRATKKLSEVKDAISSLDRRTTKYKDAVRQQVALETQLTQIRKQRIKVNKQAELSLGNLTKKQIQAKDATGSATSATMELSRVISDAPYGIRGMANNITQLVSQLGTASTKAGGLTGALKLMGQQLLGPLGIVFAITAVVSALDYFFGANEKAEKSTDLLEISVSNLNKTLNENFISQEDVNDKIREYIVLQSMKGRMSKKEEERLAKIKEAEEKINEQLEVQEKQREAIKKYRDEGNEEAASFLEKQLEDNKVINYYREEQVKLLKESQKEFNKAKQALDDFNSSEEGTLKALKATRTELQKKREVLSKTSAEYKKFSKEIAEVQKKIEAIEGRKDKGRGSSKKISPFKTKKDLDIDIKSNEEAILKYQKQTEAFRLKEQMNERVAAAETEEEKEEIRKNYQKDLLISQINAEKELLLLRKGTEEQVVKEKAKNHITDLKRIYEKYLFELKLNTKISDAEKERLKSDATSTFFESLTQAGAEEMNALDEIEEKYKGLMKTLTIMSDAKLGALMSGLFGGDKKKQDEDFDALSAYLDKFKELMSGVSDFVQGEADRQLTTEANKTNALNAELNNRLLNENLSSKERKKIQNEIAKNDEALRVKQNEIKKKAFNSQKAFNIASAVIDTYLAASKALKTFGGVPTGLPAMAATIATGLVNVATIARQKFQPDGATTPIRTSGGGGGGTGDRSFDFNLVGNNQNNQLADAIGGSLDKPVKAYVVSRDMTNQQQLDANSKSTAKFGD